MQPAATALAATLDRDSSTVPALTDAGQAALEAARALGRNAAAPATLRAYKADWTHYAAGIVNLLGCECDKARGTGWAR